MIIFLLFLGNGIIFDCYRIITITNIGFVPEFFDKFNYIIKCAFIFFSLPIILWAFQILNKQSGHPIKYPHLINLTYFSYILLISMISMMNVFSIYKTNPNELGHYSYQMDAFLYSITIIVIFVMMNFANYKLGVFIKESPKKTIKPLILYILILASLLTERLSNIGIFLVLPNTIELLTLGLSLLTLILGFALLFSIKYPDFFEFLSAYFSIISIYLIKNTGELLFEHDFQSKFIESPLDRRKVLTSGFMFGLTKGLAEILKLEKKEYEMNFGDLHLLFKHSNFVFGLIYASETTNLLSEKLTKFVKNFEDEYQEELKNWKGDMRQFNMTKIKRMIFDIFR